jgi:plastin-1
MYEKIDDGIILCKMINLASPDTIDERVINTGKNISIFKVLTAYHLRLIVLILFPVQQHENLTLAINSAKAIGCVVIGIDSHTLNSGQVRGR